MSPTYLDRPGVSHGSTCAFRYDELCALSLSATVATRARRDTCDLLVSLLSINSAPLATCARTATYRRRLYRRQLPPPHRSGAPLAPCTGLALLRSLRTHSDAAAIAHSTPQPCGTHATFLLVLDLCPLSFFGRHFFLLLFCGTPCHASSRARFPRRVLPHQHARARRARTDDAQRRTIRRAVRRSG